MNATSASTPLRVLVVDDCPDTTASLSWLLESWGHDVRVAHEGHAALEEARAYRPHVVLLDIGLPGMNGYDVAGRLRALPGLEQVSLICLSGYAAQEDRRRSQEAGFDRHFAKPADPEGLQRLLAAEKPSLPDRDASVCADEGRR